MNLDLQEKVKLNFGEWRSTDETAMLGKIQTFSQTTESMWYLRNLERQKAEE